MDPKIHCLASELFTFLSKISTSVYLMLELASAGVIRNICNFDFYFVPRSRLVIKSFDIFDRRETIHQQSNSFTFMHFIGATPTQS